ncbi:MAG: translation initiation factor 1 [Acidobacteriota bacterium]|nr:translation initiation factor 1 [Acidobacteriota bacterium]
MSNSKLVWTSDPEQAKQLRETTPSVKDTAPSAQTIRVGIDRKRRAGKSVTMAIGFQLSPDALAKLATVLKKRCGSGGTAKAGEIEIQGDHVETVAAELRKRGYRVKS